MYTFQHGIVPENLDWFSHTERSDFHEYDIAYKNVKYNT